MSPTFKKLAAGLALVGFLLTGALAGVGFAQARAATTTGVVYIRTILSGILTFNSGAYISLNGPTLRSGTGSPEGAVTAPIASMFLRTDGSTSTSVYRKESGTGNTGWVAISSADLSNLNADNLTSGNVPVARLATFLAATNAWTGANTFYPGATNDCSSGTPGLKFNTHNFFASYATGLVFCYDTTERARMTSTKTQFSYVTIDGGAGAASPSGYETGGHYIGGFFNPNNQPTAIASAIPLLVGDDGTKPTCAAAYRGVIWMDKAANGAPDTVEVCAKPTTDSYAWYTIAIIP